MVTGVVPARIESCVVCGSQEVAPDARAAMVIGLQAPFGILRCARCHMRWQSPRPTPAQLQALYASEYFDDDTASADDDPLAAYGSAPDETRRFAADNARLVEAQQTRHLARLAARFPLRGRLLEVGCGRGGFLHRARADGWQVQGLEPSASAAQAARDEGLPVQTDTLETFEPDAPVDVVYSSHVLEHFTAPTEAVRRMASWLQPGGVVFAEVPNQFEAWSAQVINRARYRLRKPRPTNVYSVHHLSFFGPDQLAQLFEDAGLVPTIESWSPHNPRNLARHVLSVVDDVAGRVARQGPNLQVIAVRP